MWHHVVIDGSKMFGFLVQEGISDQNNRWGRSEGLFPSSRRLGQCLASKSRAEFWAFFACSDGLPCHYYFKSFQGLFYQFFGYLLRKYPSNLPWLSWKYDLHLLIRYHMSLIFETIRLTYPSGFENSFAWCGASSVVLRCKSDFHNTSGVNYTL